MSTRYTNHSVKLRQRGPSDPLSLLVKQLLIFLVLTFLMLCALRARAEEPISATLVMQHGEERFRNIQDYECLADVEGRLGSRVQAGTCQLWFKQPRMLRMKVLRGSGSGSQVAIDNMGQVRGSMGGILGLIVRRIKSTDPRLLSIRGTSMLTLDWGSFFLKYHAAILRPDAQITLAPHPDASAPYEVVVAYPHLGKSVREVYSLAPQQWLILEGAVYEDTTRVEHVVFRDIKLNTGKPDGWFRL